MKEHALGLAAATLFALPAVARAQASPEVSRAETLFAEGRELRAHGDQAGACTKFDESQHLAAGIGVDLYVADCLERAGRIASAWTLFTEAAKLAAERNDPRANLAHSRAEALVPRLIRLTIVVAPGVPPLAELKVDGGATVSPAERAAGIPIDPGYHTVTLARPGKADEAAHVHVGTDDVTVTLGSAPVLERAVVAAAAKNPVPTAPIASPADATEPFGRRRLEWALVGTGLAGLGVGTAFLIARNQSMEANGAAAPPRPDGADTVGAAIAFGAGGVALVSAVILYLTDPSARETALTVRPSVMVGGGGGFVSGRF